MYDGAMAAVDPLSKPFFDAANVLLDGRAAD